jgi:hypothetical protein
MACPDVHETNVSTKLSQIEEDLRTLTEQVLHDLVVDYVNWFFCRMKHGAVVRSAELV